jgi:hypothetical protein
MLRKPDFTLNWRFSAMCTEKGTNDFSVDISEKTNQLELMIFQQTCDEEVSQKQYRVQELVDKLYDHIWIECFLGYSFKEIKAHILKTCPDLNIVDRQNFKPQKIEDYFFEIEMKARVTGSLKLHFCRKHGILSALK